MPRRKQKKYQKIENYPNVSQINQEGLMNHLVLEKIKLNNQIGLDTFLDKYSKITLELACGYAEYSLSLARHNPEIGYIGVDIKGDRIYKGAREALEQVIQNIYFIRSGIDKLEYILKKDSVDQIYLTYPDPQLKRERVRLTNQRFLEIYAKLLKPQSSFVLVTDSTELVEYTKSSILEFNKKPQLSKLSSDSNFFDLVTELSNQTDTKSFNQKTNNIRTRYQNHFESKGKFSTYLEYKYIKKGRNS